MKAIIVSFCLICAVYAIPISFSVGSESQLEVNSTESLSLSQSSENDTSELQSSEESISNQSSESESSESSESESTDNTSEESNSDSVESDMQTDLVETRDDSMGSEENIRKSWVRVFSTVVGDLSAEDNSKEVKGQPELTINKMTEKKPTPASTVKILKQTKVALVEKPTDSSDSADSSDSTALTTVTADSSQSLSSESNETSESSDSAQSSESAEDSDGSDSTELGQLKVKDCVNGTQSCESEEYFFQDIGDDAHYSVDNLLVPDEDDRELSLRR